MNKRNLATVLWFLMGSTLGSALAGIYGLPSTPVAIVAGIPFAAAVRWGPLGRIWSRPTSTLTRRPADDVAASLDRKAGALPGAATEHVRR